MMTISDLESCYRNDIRRTLALIYIVVISLAKVKEKKENVSTTWKNDFNVENLH